jgi:predicted ATPase
VDTFPLFIDSNENKRAMSHPFGDLLSQHLHRKHGLSQSRLAEGILQDPSIIGKMCKGQRLTGSQARDRVLAIIHWLCQQGALKTVGEANQLLAAAGMANLNEQTSGEQMLLQQLAVQLIPAPVAKTATQRRTNLPASLTNFVGRTQELVEVMQLVTSKRLITLTGAGGVGKTRLALEVAKRLFDAEKSRVRLIFPDGVWFVDLSTLSADSLSTTLVAQAIGMLFMSREQAAHTTLEGVQQTLADRELLLLLDNCEHLVDACAEICDCLLRHCWHLHILATSREEMRISGEVNYPLLPLSLPAAEERLAERILSHSATQLFVDRMQSASSPVQMDEQELITVAHICRQLDGMPLALELAAPLTRNLSLAEIATQLDNQMALLTNGYRTAIPRHQTMHSALIWSYRLLSPEEQQLLAQMSVFMGGWTMAAAHAVWSGEVSGEGSVSYVTSLLNQLVAKSLMLSEAQNGERRYRFLEPVRQFAHSQLVASGKQAESRRRQADYFLVLAEKMAQVRDTAHEREWLQKLEPERNNLRAVNRWAFECSNAEFAQQFNASLSVFWVYCSSVSESIYWLYESLTLQRNEQNGARTPSSLKAEADVRNMAGHAAALTHDFAKAETLFQSELALRTALNDPPGMANAMRGIAFALILSNTNLAQAQSYIDQALAICRAAQDTWGIAWSLFDLGYLALARGELDGAQTLLEGALPLFQAQGINFGAFRALLAQGHCLRAIGKNKQARQCYEDALRLQQQMNYVLHIADGLEGVGALAVAADKPQRAVLLFGAAHAHRQANALRRPLHQDADYERNVAWARRQWSVEMWNETWATGCAMTLEQAIDFALSG